MARRRRYGVPRGSRYERPQRDPLLTILVAVLIVGSIPGVLWAVWWIYWMVKGSMMGKASLL